MKGQTICNIRKLILQNKKINGVSATQSLNIGNKTSVEPNHYALLLNLNNTSRSES